MRVRIASQEDADIVGKVHSDAWKSAYRGIFPGEYIDSDTASKRKNEFLDSIKNDKCTYFVLEETNQVAGIVKTFERNNALEIESIYILSEFRGEGLGRQFIDFIKEERAGNIFLWVLEVNTNARRFYEKNGFVPTGDTRTITRGGEFKQLRYELRR